MSTGRALITKVQLRNYKSIAACSIELGELTFLVGPNGSGKSNFLDGLRFTAESLRTSLDHALRDRGTIREVRRRSGGHPNHFSIRLDFRLPNGGFGHYAFQVGAKEFGGFEVQDEECKIIEPSLTPTPVEAFFHIKRGKLQKTSIQVAPPAFHDRLFLVAAAGLPEFRPVYDALSRLEVYNINPQEIRNMQRPDAGELLRRDGSNAASVLDKLPKLSQERIKYYLSRIVPGVSDVATRILGSQETVEFRQAVKGQKHPWRFLAASMSDGTLRALGVLLALFQATRGKNEFNGFPPLIGLEEPETALHPAAAKALLSGLREAAKHTQILVTSHSPDLLDDPDISTESIFAVDNVEGVTALGPIDEAGRLALKDSLFTPGELLRQNQLAIDRKALSEATERRQVDIFEYDAP
jgi:predicted ATPase